MSLDVLQSPSEDPWENLSCFAGTVSAFSALYLAAINNIGLHVFGICEKMLCWGFGMKPTEPGTIATTCFPQDGPTLLHSVMSLCSLWVEG